MIRVAVIGVGYWGPNLVSNFHNHQQSEVAVVVDRDAKRLDLVRQRFPELNASQDVAAVLASPDIDAVVVATPTGTHYEVVKAALEQDFFPDTISTDIHIPPPGRTVYLMNDLVSKFHALGLSLEGAISASTVKPAKVLGLEDSIGSLKPGMSGDAAVFDLREGRFVWHDMAGHNVEGKVRLDTFLTVRAGNVVWREGRLTHMGQC